MAGRGRPRRRRPGLTTCATPLARNRPWPPGLSSPPITSCTRAAICISSKAGARPAMAEPTAPASCQSKRGTSSLPRRPSERCRQAQEAKHHPHLGDEHTRTEGQVVGRSRARASPVVRSCSRRARPPCGPHCPEPCAALRRLGRRASLGFESSSCPDNLQSLWHYRSRTSPCSPNS